MKRAIWVLTIICLSAFSVIAQGGKTKPVSTATPATASVRLENNSPALIYYMVAEGSSAELKSLSTDGDTATNRLRSGELRYLSAYSSNPNVAVSDRESLIIGLSVESGSVVYPLWTLRIPAKNARVQDAWYSVSQAKPVSDGKTVATVGAFDITFPPASFRIDGGFVDWLNVADSMTFLSRFVPATAVQNAGDGKKAINPGSASFWKRGGTDIEHFKIVKTVQEWDLMFASFSMMGPGLSYILRVYAPDSKEANAYTLEIPLAGKGGPVVLWTKNSAAPKVVGEFAVGDYYAEARIDRSVLPAEILKLLDQNVAFELSSAYRDGGISEEFYFGRVSLSNIVNIE